MVGSVALPAALAGVLHIISLHGLALLIPFGAISFLGGAVVTGMTVAAVYMRHRFEDSDQITIDFEQFGQFDHGRVPSEWTVRRKIRAVRDGVDRYMYEYEYHGNPGPTAFEMLYGGMAKLASEERGKHLVEIRYGRTLQRGDEHEFSFRMRIPADAGEPPPYLSVSPPTPVRTASVRVRFAPDCLPDKVWKSRWYTRQALEPVSREEVTLSADGSVKVDFRGLLPGFRYGLFWKW